MKILFQGDSITDAGRSYDMPEDLGNGYPFFVSVLLNVMIPDNNFEFINRGISGNRTIDLAGRWKKDCIDLKPDFISILIGINDVWRRYDNNDPTSAEAFRKNYDKLLSEIRKKLPDTKILLLEPFVLPVPKDRKDWRSDLDPKIQIARELAAKFKTNYVSLDGIFANYSIKSSPENWAADGVHPTPSGHMLIAQEWINEFQNML